MNRRSFLRLGLGSVASLLIPTPARPSEPRWDAVAKAMKVMEDGLRERSLYSSHLQPIKVHRELGRKGLFKLGRRGVYHRFVNFPVKLTKSVEVAKHDH